MRSRYTAFALGDLDYIEKTITEHASQSFKRIDIERSLTDTEWLGLQVRGTTDGQETDDVVWHLNVRMRPFRLVMGPNLRLFRQMTCRAILLKLLVLGSYD
ncbi:YchJ family metal-binding protein [Neorhizobium lilium]|uniref:YchJ family metal-binding protein n=1 Tax=Neorhizobium lilium TaxID=2503024 RepID=UPI00197E4BDB|nr:YchJ family metal-binding protein [Neorhizobium lilium]